MLILPDQQYHHALDILVTVNSFIVTSSPLWYVITQQSQCQRICISSKPWLKLHNTKKRRKKKSKVTKTVCLSGWLLSSLALILTQRSAEIKGTEEEEKKKGRKGLVSHAGGCQGCLPKETHISALSQIRNEQKFSWVHAVRQPDIKWRPWLSKQAPCYYVYLIFIWDFTLAFIGTEGTTLRVKCGYIFDERKNWPVNVSSQHLKLFSRCLKGRNKF